MRIYRMEWNGDLECLECVAYSPATARAVLGWLYVLLMLDVNK